MKVKELIEILQKENPNDLVILQKDGEGNGFSPCAGYWTGSYKSDTSWSGEVGLRSLTDHDRNQGYSEEDVVDGQPSIVLYPIN